MPEFTLSTNCLGLPSPTSEGIDAENKLNALIDLSVRALQAESEVTAQHTDKAQKYIAAIGVILGFHVVEMKDLVFTGSTKLALSAIVLAGIGVLLVAMWITLMSMRVRVYPTFPETQALDVLRSKATSERETKERILDVYLDIRDGILKVNQQRGRLLRMSGSLLMIGFFASVVGQMALKIV